MVRILLFQKWKLTSVGKVIQKLGHLYTVGGNVKWYSLCRKQYAGFSSKHRITILSNNSTSRHIPKRTESRDSNRYLHTKVHSSIIHNSQKVEATQVSISKINGFLKIWYKHTMEYYSALNWNKILIYAATWMNLENIMLCEIILTQKDKYCVIQLIWGI